MKRLERMGGPRTAKVVGEECRLTVLGGLGGLLDLSRNTEVRVLAPADTETSLRSSRLTVL